MSGHLCPHVLLFSWDRFLEMVLPHQRVHAFYIWIHCSSPGVLRSGPWATTVAASPGNLREMCILGPHPGFPGSSAGKESTCNAGDLSLIPGSGSSPEEEISSIFLGFPGGSDSKESIYNAGDLGSIPGLGRSAVRGDGNPLQYSCLEDPHGWRSPAGYSPWGCKELDMTERLGIAQHRTSLRHT